MYFTQFKTLIPKERVTILRIMHFDLIVGSQLYFSPFEASPLTPFTPSVLTNLQSNSKLVSGAPCIRKKMVSYILMRGMLVFT